MEEDEHGRLAIALLQQVQSTVETASGAAEAIEAFLASEAITVSDEQCRELRNRASELRFSAELVKRSAVAAATLPAESDEHQSSSAYQRVLEAATLIGGFVAASQILGGDDPWPADRRVGVSIDLTGGPAIVRLRDSEVSVSIQGTGTAVIQGCL